MSDQNQNTVVVGSTAAPLLTQPPKQFTSEELKNIMNQYYTLAGGTPKPLTAPQIIGAQRPVAVKEYQSRAKQRVAIPVLGLSLGGDASLEMTLGTEGDMVEFTLLIPGRQSVNFRAHRKDLEAITNELTLAKLAK